MGVMPIIRAWRGHFAAAAIIGGLALPVGAAAPRVSRVPVPGNRTQGAYAVSALSRLNPWTASAPGSVQLGAPKPGLSLSAPVLAAPAVSPGLTAAFGAVSPAAPGAEEARMSPTAALLEHGPQAAEFAAGTLEDAPGSMEKNFELSAALGRPGGAEAVSVPGSDSSDGFFSGLFGGKSASAKLGRRLLEKLELDDHGNPAERRLLEKVVRRLMDSPTARRYTEDLLASGGRAKVSFEEVGGYRVVEEGGRKTFHGIFGETNFDGDIPHVRLNRQYLESDADFVMAHAPKALGHELLGHVVYHVKAAALDLVWPFRYYKDNETLSGLVEWIITAELGEKLSNGRMWQYLQSPDQYHRNLHVVAPFYAGTFDRAEARDLEGTLRARQERVRSELRAGEEDARNWGQWKAIAEHFIAHHQVDPEALSEVLATVEASLENRRLGAKEMAAIDSYIQHLLDALAQEEGRKWAAGFLASMSHSFFESVEAEVARLTRHLRDLVEQRQALEPKMSAAAPRPATVLPGQITFDELGAMYRDDLARNPGHWRK